MTNGIFRDDAERDAAILRLDEQLKATREGVIELKSDIKELIACVEEVRREQSHLKTWIGIFSAVFIPLVASLAFYLLQRILK